WVKMHQNPNSEIVLLDDWEEKIKHITKRILNEDITNITGVPSWMYLLLQNIVTVKGANTLIEVWPNLEVYIHGGIDFSSYKSNFEKLIGSNKMNYLEIYNASEGFFGVQDDPLRNDLLLMLNHGIFYEFIPVSKESLYESHFKAGKDMLALYCNNFPQKSIFNGKGLMLGGSQTQNKKHGFIEGDLSAILIENFPFWVKMHQNPNSEIVLLDDWEEKIKRITEKLLHENITNMTGVPSWMYLLLQNIVTEKGVNTLIEVWPNLEVYIHGGIDFSSYKSNFKKLIGSDEVNYLEIYNASEGFFGIQDDPLRNDLLLMLNHGIFYEFIPIKKFRNGIMETVTLEDVKEEESYALVISTSSGLWRYLIGDTISFTSIKPYKIVISGRTKSYINMFGEELMVGNTNQALHNTCQSTSSKITEYTVSPILYEEMCGVHEWIIEFETPPLNMKEFQIKLDVELKKVNSDYAAKRSKDLLIKSPIIRTVKKGTFYNWSSAKDRLGGQYKIPRLSNKRTFAEEIIKYED
ncbi:MAG: GH3 auxin-responsive promoter family protein, partial [Bacteroidota bacterium]|nr:GH3 auxin-responsive promoter family protein [Bacteroidota bacterium]